MSERLHPHVSVVSALIVALALVLSSANARGDYDEYKVKAAFLINFARLVTWPGHAAPAQGTPLVIGVHASPSVTGSLSTALADAKIPGHSVRVRPVGALEEIDDCHILFVADDDPESARGWVVAARGRGTLTVGESAGFARDGGMINFFTEEQKIRFEINPKAANREGLKISSRLLRLARLVSDAS